MENFFGVSTFIDESHIDEDEGLQVAIQMKIGHWDLAIYASESDQWLLPGSHVICGTRNFADAKRIPGDEGDIAQVIENVKIWSDDSDMYLIIDVLHRCIRMLTKG